MFTFEIKARTYTHYDSEAGVYVASCPELHLVSQGETEEEAERAIQSAINLFIITCYEHDILHTTLKRFKESGVQPHVGEHSTQKDVQFTVQLAA